MNRRVACRPASRRRLELGACGAVRRDLNKGRNERSLTPNQPAEDRVLGDAVTKRA